MRGPDIMALGEAKGPAIGEILRQVEAEWVAGGFAAIARDAARTRGGAQPKITQARPISVAAKGEHDRQCRDLDQHIAAALLAGRGADRAVEKLAKACLPGRPARIATAIGRGEQEQREEDDEEQRHDRQQVVGLHTMGEGEPSHRDEPEGGGDGGFDGDGMDGEAGGRLVPDSADCSSGLDVGFNIGLSRIAGSASRLEEDWPDNVEAGRIRLRQFDAGVRRDA